MLSIGEIQLWASGNQFIIVNVHIIEGWINRGSGIIILLSRVELIVS